jgi:hypothetical protein
VRHTFSRPSRRQHSVRNTFGPHGPIDVSWHAAHELSAAKSPSPHANMQNHNRKLPTFGLRRTHFDRVTQCWAASAALQLLSRFLSFSYPSRHRPGKTIDHHLQIKNELSICQFPLYQDWVSLPVLSQTKPQAPPLHALLKVTRYCYLWLVYQARRACTLSQVFQHLRLWACMSLPPMHIDDTAARANCQLAAQSRAFAWAGLWMPSCQILLPV